jgi:hypothetical protein
MVDRGKVAKYFRVFETRDAVDLWEDIVMGARKRGREPWLGPTEYAIL